MELEYEKATLKCPWCKERRAVAMYNQRHIIGGGAHNPVVTDALVLKCHRCGELAHVRTGTTELAQSAALGVPIRVRSKEHAPSITDVYKSDLRYTLNLGFAPIREDL